MHHTLLRHLALLTALLSPLGATTSKPNILVILTDDQRADTIRALGNPHIITPNLDKLAARSLVFSNAYCYGAHTGAVCIASRNQFQTGRTWHRWAPRKHCPADGQTMPKVMKAAGYETYYAEKSGKANHPQILTQYDHSTDVHNVRALMSGRACRPFVDGALEFLREKRDTKKPFFMYLGVAGPHDPRFSEKRFRDLYDPAKIPLPENFKPIHHWDIGSMTIRDESLEKWPRGEEETRSHIFDYYALVTAMDHDLGRLFDHLDQSGLTKNTIVIFSSDHGLALGSHGLFGKQNIYEAGMKVPFLVSGPGIAKGSSDALVYLHDIFPTVADFADGKLAEPIDGRNLRPVIDGEEKKVRDHATLAYQASQRSVRDERWKLMVFPLINRHQLFDLANDPGETRDLAAKHPEQVQRLMKLLRTELTANGDNQPLTTADPKPADFPIPKNAKVAPRHRVGGQSTTSTD